MDPFTIAILAGLFMLELRTQYKLGKLEARVNNLNSSLSTKK